MISLIVTKEQISKATSGAIKVNTRPNLIRDYTGNRTRIFFIISSDATGGDSSPHVMKLKAISKGHKPLAIERVANGSYSMLRPCRET